jgi:hypothetical protein
MDRKRMKELPIACELTPAELEARRQGLLQELLAQATDCVPLSDGFRWRFAPSTEVLMAAVKTIDAERQCCRFLKFALTVEPDAGEVWLEVTGPDGTREFLLTLLS